MKCGGLGDMCCHGEDLQFSCVGEGLVCDFTEDGFTPTCQEGTNVCDCILYILSAVATCFQLHACLETSVRSVKSSRCLENFVFEVEYSVHCSIHKRKSICALLKLKNEIDRVVLHVQA